MSYSKLAAPALASGAKTSVLGGLSSGSGSTPETRGAGFTMLGAPRAAGGLTGGAGTSGGLGGGGGLGGIGGASQPYTFELR